MELGASVFAIDDIIADLQGHGVVLGAGTYGDYSALLGFFFGGVGDDDTASGFLFGGGGLDDHAVGQRFDC